MVTYFNIGLLSGAGFIVAVYLRNSNDWPILPRHERVRIVGASIFGAAAFVAIWPLALFISAGCFLAWCTGVFPPEGGDE